MIVPGQFNVSATGAFSYTIPIAVPPGTSGMVPALSLDYSSQAGDGLEGLGWTLSGLPSIGRCPRTLTQENIHGGVNYDANDRFCMEGQRLVAISGSYGADGTVYRTEVEGFSKIISHGTSGTGPAYFEVHTKAGQIMYFGYAEDTDNTSNNSRLTISATNLTARAWAVEKIADTKGNFLIVKYTNDMTNGQAYPNEVDYTGNDGASLTPFASVKFVYTSRSDIIPTYQAGFLMQTTKLLSNIQTYIGATMVANYKLAYTLATGGTQHDELTSVTECDGGTNCLKPTTFGWQGSRDTLTMATTPIGIAQGTGTTLGSIMSGDWNGDGLTDVLTSSTTSCNIYYNTQSSGFVVSGIVANYTSWTRGDEGWEETPYTGPPCFKGPTAKGPKAFIDYNGDGITDQLLDQQFATSSWVLETLHNDGLGNLSEISDLDILGPGTVADYNGDGLTDVMGQYTATGTHYFFYGDGTGGYGQSTASFANGLTLIAGDFDGDGCTDILQQGATKAIAYSCNPAVSSYTVPDWSSRLIVLGDFNGDGKIDVLLVTPGGGTGTLYLSTGTALVAQSFTVPTTWGKFQIVTGDWNGDGKTDIALIAAGNSGGYTHGTDHQLWLSNGSGFVEAPFTIPNSNTADTKEDATAADWNNDGATDIWLKKPSGDTEYLFSYVPELMTSVNNGLGITTTVTYDRLNKNSPLYQKCSTSGTYVCGDAYPTQDLDGPLYVVSRVDSSNGIAGTYSSTYSYSGAQANLTGRGFLGFAQMAVKDLQTGIVQTTNYETQFPYLGLIASQTKVCPTPVCTTAVTLNSTTNTYESISLGTGTDGVARTFVGLHLTVIAANDLDGTAFPTTTTTYTYDCDS